MLSLASIAQIDFADFPLEPLLGIWRSLGVETIQPCGRPDVLLDAAGICGATNGAGLRIDSYHAVFGDQYDPSSPDEQVRRRSVETYMRQGEVGLALGGPRVVVHPSPAEHPPGSPGVRHDQLRKSIEALARHGQDNRIVYLLENQPPYHPLGADVEELARIVGELGHPNLAICLDVGHANMNGDPAAAVLACGPLLGYTHMHDNDGKIDQHALPMTGTVDWCAVAAALGRINYTGPFCFEVFEQLEDLRRLTDADWRAKLTETLKRV